MATDALRKVKETEALATDRLRTAEAEAAGLVRKARDDAQSRADEKIRAAKTEAASTIEQAKEEGQRERATLVKAAEVEAERLREDASSRRTDAVSGLTREIIRS
jgi:vacuolar-type H+-ATPase subunit H